MEPLLVPMYAIGALVVLAVGVVLFRRFVPVKREISHDFFGSEPRATTPTQPDPEEVAAPPTPDPEMQGSANDRRVLTAPDPFTTATAPPITRATSEGSGLLSQLNQAQDQEPKCCACGQPADPSLIELEDWQQVNRLVGAVLAFLGYRSPVTPGRRLYLRRSWCRSCAAIADVLNSRFERDEQARAAATRRVWERRGLVDAVKAYIADADGRYDDEKRRLERAARPWERDG
jgi:hypothetical protein